MYFSVGVALQAVTQCPPALLGWYFTKIIHKLYQGQEMSATCEHQIVIVNVMTVVYNR